MHFRAIFRILGVLLMVFSLSMLPPIGVAWWYRDGTMFAFAAAFLVTVATGCLLWLPCRKYRHEIRVRDGFLVVVLFWTVLSLFGAIPFVIDEFHKISITDAIFESVSGLTTTGTNVFSGIDLLPHAIRYYRQELQFLGGMGIIVLAVAVLPMLGIGGMQLYRAETPGPIKDNKLTPRITETAKTLWYIYLGLTLACIVSYWFAGMPLFDAVGESFSTVATGGFSVHDSSFAYYHSIPIDLIACLFMFLSACNYGLHYAALQRRTLITYWRDAEFRAFAGILFVVFVIITTVLMVDNIYRAPSEAIVNTLFTVISLGTTTGLTTARFDLWPSFIPFLIMFTALIGGCAASTCGGLKVLRVLLLQKQGARELKRLVHPKAVLTIRLGEHVLDEDVVQAIWGFVAMFILLSIILLLMLLATGLDFVTAFGALASCLSNAGASIGGVANSFERLNDFAKWICIFAMFAGRLEIFTLLILFTPTFWRR